MSQATFWDGDEREYQLSVTKIKAAGHGVVIKEAAPASAPAPRRDFKLNKTVVDESEPATATVAMTAEHLAAQLVKLYKMGVVSGPDDSELVFYAALIKEMNGTVVTKIACSVAENKLDDDAIDVPTR